MLTRRAILKTGAAIAAVSAMRVSAQSATTVVRRSVTQMQSDDPDLEAYRKAVDAMMKLPTSDPRNWANQALIHTNHCPHNNWYFLPWHRAYLYAFEEVCRELSGKADFALPYWDWILDRQLPTPFRQSTGAANVLFHARPGFPENASLPSETFSEETLTRILDAATFEEFGSTRPTGQDGTGSEWQRRVGDATELEFGPHNGVHGILSGDMGRVNRSPLDPIFWLHHCNIDRIWTLWSTSHSSAPLDPLFLNMQFAGQFFVPTNPAFAPAVQDLLGTEAFGYRYDPVPSVVNANDPILIERIQGWQTLPLDVLNNIEAKFDVAPIAGPPGQDKILLASSDKGGVADKKSPLSIPLTASTPIDSLIGEVGLTQSGLPDIFRSSGGAKVFTKVRLTSLPKDLSTAVRIFVNCGYLDPSIKPDDPHYVTTVSFFGAGEHAEHGGAAGELSLSIDLTDALGAVRRNGDLSGDQLIVQFMPVGSADAESTAVTVGKVDAAIL